MKQVQGGVAAPTGFYASGMHCGIRANKGKKDLAMIYCEKECSAAGVFTKNTVKAASVLTTMQVTNAGRAQAVICNSGNANACAPNGMENAKAMADAAAAACGISPGLIIVGSTGVIGQELNTAPIAECAPQLFKALSKDGSGDAADAIMTTDTAKKEIAVTLDIGGAEVTFGAIAKGSGMIHPNMGTMLGFVTTDAAISHEMLQKALSDVVKKTFNRVTVDGDTSTNDMVCVMASGLAGNPEIVSAGDDYDAFLSALLYVCTYLARSIAKDGEGATKLITCSVSGAASEEDAETLSKAVISSSLVKAAMFGEDANWGRIVCAMGYSGVDFDISGTTVAFRSEYGEEAVFKDGVAIDFSEENAAAVLKSDEITIDISLSGGSGNAVCWGCDLTYEYVKINGDYRT